MPWERSRHRACRMRSSGRRLAQLQGLLVFSQGGREWRVDAVLDLVGNSTLLDSLSMGDYDSKGQRTAMLEAAIGVAPAERAGSAAAVA